MRILNASFSISFWSREGCPGPSHNAASLVSNSAPLETFLGPPPEAQAQADVPLAPDPKRCGVREHKTEERRGEGESCGNHVSQHRKCLYMKGKSKEKPGSREVTAPWETTSSCPQSQAEACFRW